MTDKTLSQVHIILSQEQIEAFCRRHQVRKLSLFGSVLRDDFTDDSDVDVLVEFEPEAKPGLFTLVKMSHEFEELVGRKVDLMTPGFLSRYFRQQVLDTALVVYEKSPENDPVRIRHMLDFAYKLKEYTDGKSRGDLEPSGLLALALARLIELFGEAASWVSEETRTKYPQIPWRIIN